MRSTLNFLQILGLDQCVCLQECIYGDNDETKADQRGDHDSDHFQSLEPHLVVPTDRLEHAPESVAEMEPKCHKPDEVDQRHPPSSESGGQKEIRILGFGTHEFTQLHLRPEVGEVEKQDSQDDDSQDEHILGGPRVHSSPAAGPVPLVAAARPDIVPGQVAAVEDVDEETHGQNRHQDRDHRGGHEVAAELEQSVSGGKQLLIRGDHPEFPREGVDDRKQIDRYMKQQEDHKKCPADRLD